MRTKDEVATMARKAMADQMAVQLLDNVTPEVILATLAKTPGRRSLELRAAVIRMTSPGE